jgi:hypothetical protein
MIWEKFFNCLKDIRTSNWLVKTVKTNVVLPLLRTPDNQISGLFPQPSFNFFSQNV